MKIKPMLAACAAMLALCGAAGAADAPVLAPSGFCAAADGGVLIADIYQRAIWQWDGTDALPVRYAGLDGAKDVNGRPVGGYYDGALQSAAFQSPWAIAPYGAGYAVTDADNHLVRYIADGRVYTLAGGARAGYHDASGTSALLNLPTGLTADGEGNLYVSDTGNNRIRKIDAKGTVTTFAGGEAGNADGSLKNARFTEPTGLFYENGTLYVCDSGNNRIVKIADGTVQTIAGSTVGEAGYREGSADAALLDNPQGVAAGSAGVYIADTGNGAVRLLADGRVQTVCAPASFAGGLYPVEPRALLLRGNALLVGDVFARTLFSIPAKPEQTPTFADVDSAAPYAEAVSLLSARGLMAGTSAGRFSPDAALDRAMAVTVLSRLMAQSLPSTVIDGDEVFTDVAADAYYGKAVAWAAANGLVQGSGGAFSPHRALTNAEFITMLYRLAPLIGMDMDKYEDGNAYPLAPTWAQAAYAFASGNGLIGAEVPAPAQAVSRADAAVLLTRFMELAEL